jgi:hypothetical protein
MSLSTLLRTGVEFYTAQSTVGIQLYDRVPVLTLIGYIVFK